MSEGQTVAVGDDDSVQRSETKTILIVEDNAQNLKLFVDLLEVHGYETLECQNGNDALHLAREHKPDLILMDVQLREVSGLEVVKCIKEEDALKSIPVIVVTAFAMSGDEEKIMQSGCVAYITKPIAIAQFLETIDHFLS